MGKQAVGTIGYNQWNRADTLLFLMNYPQRPLVKSKTLEMINFEKLPAGQNASVAVMSYSGYDIEDAIVLNRASLDRGFGRASTIRRNVCSVDIEKFSNISDRIVPPPEPKPNRFGKINPMKYKKFHALGRDGLANVATKLEAGDVYVNKEVPVLTEQERRMDVDPSEIEYRAQPQTYGTPLPAYVDRMIISSNPEESNQYVNVKMIQRQTRIPEVGDKFSSRHGQKGVVGLIVP